jgi:DNA-binding protein HU-beta
MSQNRHLPVA